MLVYQEANFLYVQQGKSRTQIYDGSMGAISNFYQRECDDLFCVYMTIGHFVYIKHGTIKQIIKNDWFSYDGTSDNHYDEFIGSTFQIKDTTYLCLFYKNLSFVVIEFSDMSHTEFSKRGTSSVWSDQAVLFSTSYSEFLAGAQIKSVRDDGNRRGIMICASSSKLDKIFNVEVDYDGNYFCMIELEEEIVSTGSQIVQYGNREILYEDGTLTSRDYPVRHNVIKFDALFPMYLLSDGDFYVKQPFAPFRKVAGHVKDYYKSNLGKNIYMISEGKLLLLNESVVTVLLEKTPFLLLPL